MSGSTGKRELPWLLLVSVASLTFVLWPWFIDLFKDVSYIHKLVWTGLFIGLGWFAIPLLRLPSEGLRFARQIRNQDARLPAVVSLALWVICTLPVIATLLDLAELPLRSASVVWITLVTTLWIKGQRRQMVAADLPPRVQLRGKSPRKKSRKRGDG